MHLNFGEKWLHIPRMMHLGHLKPILKYKIGVVNRKVSSLVAFHYFFSEWLAYMWLSSARARRAAHDILKHVWAKLISLCLLDRSTGVL